MPLVKLHTSVPLDDAARTRLLVELSARTAAILGKPEAYVMTIVDQAAICMAGTVGPAAFVDLRSIGGLSAARNRQLAAELGSLLERALGVAPSRIYLNFTDVAADAWGHDGSTFG